MHVPSVPSAESVPSVAGKSDQLSILLVEDDPGDALLVEEYLIDSGLDARLTRAQSLAEAARLLVDPPDCVLLDLGLPDGAGQRALETMLELLPGAVILVITGLDDLKAGVTAVRMGAQDYLVKGRVDGELIGRAIRYGLLRKESERATQALRESELRAQENARLERGLLPTPLLAAGTVQVHAAYRAGRQRALLGGDFYDVVEAPDGTILALVGDVCGHGADEAALGVCLRVAWRALVLAGLRGLELLQLLEHVLVAERDHDWRYATVCTVAVPPDRTYADITLAGHPPPLVVGDTAVRPADVRYAVPLGLGLDGARPWSVDRINLATADAMLLYTDGLIESHAGTGGDRLNIEGLAEIVRVLAPDTEPGRLPDALLAAVQRGDAGRSSDDLAAVYLTWGPR